MQNCADCGKVRDWIKTGRLIDGRVERRCCNCGRVQLEPPRQGLYIPKKVLYVDIETSTMKVEMETFDLRVRSGWLDWHDISHSFYVICWAAAWVGESKIMSGKVTGEEAIRRDDKRHLERLRNLLDMADYLTWHNGKLFDLKKLETRFLLNEMRAPLGFKQFDTLAFAKKRFGAESNALAYWSKLLGGDPKDRMCKEDWIECNKGNERVIRKMLHYNQGDVREGVNVLNRFVEYAESDGITKVFK